MKKIFSKLIFASAALLAAFVSCQKVEEISEGYIDLTGLTEYNGVKLATGATVTKEALLKEDLKLNILDFGAVALENRAEGDTDTHAVENTEAINKAILDANLGFTPRHEGDILRIIIPPLTEERRKELSKAAKVEVENSKVNIRNARRNVMDKVKKLKDKAVPEDEVKQVEKEIQDITDKFVAECDQIFAKKEKEIMTV